MSFSNQSPELANTPIRVCIVDDDHDVGLTLKRVIQTLGTFEIRLQTEPCDIQAETLSWKPDVVFTDLVMPEMDGFAVIDQVRCCDPDITVKTQNQLSTVARVGTPPAWTTLPSITTPGVLITP